MAPKLLPLREVELRLGLTRWTLYELIRAGRLPAIKLQSGHYRVREEVVDLMDLADPDHLASDSGRYTMPYVTIESVLPLDGPRLIIVNDNNFPAVGARAMGRRDDTEFILLQVEFDPQSP